MTMRKVSLDVPSDMVRYIESENDKLVFARNAMMLYPYIQNLTISHGKAAEILGVRKTDLIEFYDSMGIPYLNQSQEELDEDLATLHELLGAEG